MFDTGKISLIIANEKLDFDNIAMQLNITPTKMLRKGDCISKILGPNTEDVWIYEEEAKTVEELNHTICKFLSNDFINQKELGNIIAKNRVILKCYIQSLYAQISLDLYPYTLNLLADSNIPFRLNIMSWGNVSVE